MSDVPAWGTPEPAGTEPPSPAQDLFTLTEFAVLERAGGFFRGGYYDLVAPDERPLARFAQEPGRFLSSRKDYTLTAADGRVTARVVDPGGWGRTRFEVSDGEGRPVGLMRDEKALFGPRQLVLEAADGGVARLSGGGFGSGGVHEFTDSQDRPIGEARKQFGWGAFFAGTDLYTVRLTGCPPGPLTVLATLAIVCVDLLRNEENRNHNPGFHT